MCLQLLSASSVFGAANDGFCSVERRSANEVNVSSKSNGPNNSSGSSSDFSSDFISIELSSALINPSSHSIESSESVITRNMISCNAKIVSLSIDD